MPKSSGFYSEQTFYVDNTFTEITLLHRSENGYSEVHKALRHGKWHVLKCLTGEEKGNPRFQQLLRKEFEISYQLTHPSIVHTLGMEEVEGLGVCIIQEYIDGVMWEEFFRDNKVTGKEKTRILSELCLALDNIHQRQIVHRDITPKNVIITRDGHHPRIIDFGLADRDIFVYLKEPAGTTGYASPEQQRPGILDNRSDIYSLGVLVDGITSRCDFTLRRIARKCLANNPASRPVSAMEIHRMLTPVRWWRWVMLIGVAVVCAVALTWQTHDTYQREQIEHLQQRIRKQDSITLRQQQQMRQQHERLSSVNRSMVQIGSSLDSVEAVNKGISKRIDSEDQQAARMERAKKELHAIARQHYQKIWDSHDELSLHPDMRRRATDNEVYLVEWQPIVRRLIEKHHLDANSDKVLMDEWLVALYSIVNE